MLFNERTYYKLMKKMVKVDEECKNNFIQSKIHTSLTKKEIIKTRCCFVYFYLRHFLSFHSEDLIFNNYYTCDFPIINFHSLYAYEIDFIGLKSMHLFKKDYKIANKLKTIESNINHKCILIYIDKWYLIDSYIGNRELTIRPIKILDLIKFIMNIRIVFNSNNWNNYFDTHVESKKTKCIYTKIYKHKWNTTFVNEKIQYIKNLYKLLKY